MIHLKGSARYCWLLVLTLLLASLALAQETTAGLQGTVKDQSGAVVSKASVEATSTALIGSAKVTTDAAGYYRFANLPPGEYTLVITAPGFKKVKQEGLKLQAGSLPTIEFKLEVGGQEQIVEVQASAAVVDVTTSKVETQIPSEVLSEIPKGRSFQSVIPFAPGARQEPLQTARTDAGRQNGFQIDGASDSENVYMVEGMNTTSIYGGGVGANVPMEFVQEVQVKSSSFEAEFGGATGGVVNVISKRGGPQWHGSLFAYYRGNGLDGNNQCITRGYTNTTCGLRLKPGTSFSGGSGGTPANPLFWSNMHDGTPEYYLQKKDKWTVVEPGFEVGGPLFSKKLWLFSSYIPTLSSTARTVNYTSSNPGSHSFTRTDTTHNFMNRLDYGLTNNIRLFGAWQSGYTRTKGVNLPATPDSLTGQTNNAASTDPNSLRADTGSVNPLTILNFGGDWTVSSKMVVTSRFGYMYYNSEDRGKPQGARYVYQSDATCDAVHNPTSFACTTLVGSAAVLQHSNGYYNIPNNQAQRFDIFSRRQFTTDVSYFLTDFFGTHNLKSGYQVSRVAENVLQAYDSSLANIYIDQTYKPNGADKTCAGLSPCRGTYGYYILSDGVNTNGNVSALNHSIYLQDAWTFKRLTVNAGVRFDKEFLPPYSSVGSSINFGFGDKIAPRIGAAYDLLGNGKVKVYGSYGKFFDIMKYSLPRGSFGGDRWHDCVYTLDDPDLSKIAPNNVSGHFCPDSGPALGSTTGTFIENFNWRASTGFDSRDPRVDPNIKPYQQHEYVLGADWALSNRLSLSTRFSHKALDQAIEDIAADDNTFYIGNPGSPFSQVLQRTLYSAGYSAPICPDCPATPKAKRVYNGFEVRLVKKATDKWFGQIAYTYSHLTGNYPGLSSSYVTDGNGGRHEPNNNRSFDVPTMAYDSHGKLIDGPLPTDRPHALTAFAFYNLKWFRQNSMFGFTQQVASGTPLSTCMPTVDSTSSCQFVENQGNWVNYHSTADGTIVQDSVSHGKRTSVFSQTDFNFTHELKVNKQNENMRLAFNINISNLFNQHAPLSVVNVPIAGSNLVVTPVADNVLGYDMKAMLTGWNYLAVANDRTAVLNSQGKYVYAGMNANGAPNTLAARYGMPNLYQNNRSLRLQVKFSF